MTYAEFRRHIEISREDIFRQAFEQHREAIRVKKEDTAVRNLQRIFDATLRISNEKGFQAMTLRDLGRETGLSIGALYGYFSSKEALLEMLQHLGRTVTSRLMEERLAEEQDPRARLRTAIRTHLYLSESMQSWFYFSYMEAKNLSEGERRKAVRGELYTEKLFMDILKQGEAEGVLAPRDHRLAASVLKAMLQDWYLKRWKYAKRRVSVDRYADFITGILERYYAP
jgi:AcrR family transcriptional regulator